MFESTWDFCSARANFLYHKTPVFTAAHILLHGNCVSLLSVTRIDNGTLSCRTKTRELEVMPAHLYPSIPSCPLTLVKTFLDFASYRIDQLGLIMSPVQKGEENPQTHLVFLKLQSLLWLFLIFFLTAVQIRKFGCCFLWGERELKAINGGSKWLMATTCRQNSKVHLTRQASKKYWLCRHTCVYTCVDFLGLWCRLGILDKNHPRWLWGNFSAEWL